MVNLLIIFFLILIVIIFAVVGRFIMLMIINLSEFLFFKVKTFSRFKNMVICTFWQTLYIFSKADKYKWK